MAIRPVEIVAMQRMADISQVKQQENLKPMTDQANFQNQLAKEVQQASEQVVRKADIDNDTGKYDAKEKGKNEYHRDGKVKIKKKDGSRLVADENPDVKGLFDVSI